MNKETRDALAKELAQLLKTEENIQLLVKFLLPTYSVDDTKIGDKYFDIYGGIDNDNLTFDHMGMKFAAVKDMQKKIVAMATELLAALNDKPEAPKEKKTYK